MNGYVTQIATDLGCEPTRASILATLDVLDGGGVS